MFENENEIEWIFEKEKKTIIHYRRKFIIPNNNKNGKDEQPEWTRINEWME